MTKNDQLHELVHSLSKNEKGYFKKYCKMYSSQQDQKYLKLFEAVDGVENYSDKLIKQKLKGEIEERKLAVLKNYLYRLILKVLEHFYSNKYPDLEISNLINQAKVLYYKGLISHARKILKKAKQQAEIHEFLYLKGEIMQLEQKLANTSAKSKTKYEENKTFFDTEMQNIDRIKHLIKCRDLERKVIDQHWLQGLSTEGEIISLERILDDLNITVDTSSSVTANLHYYNACVLHQYVTGGDLTIAYEHAATNFNLIKNNPKISQQDERKYIRILYTYLGLCLLLKKEIAFLEGIEILEAFKSKDIRTQADVFDLKYNLLFNYVIVFHQFEQGERYIKQYQKELNKYLSYIAVRSQIVLNHLVAYIHQINGHHELAMQHIDAIYDLKDEETRIDIQAIARIQDVLIHFDLGHWSIVISKVRSCTRFLRQKNHYYPINALLLNTIFSIAKKPKTAYEDVFKKLEKKLLALTIEDPAEKKFFEHFDFGSWVHHKAQKISFKEAFLAVKGKKHDQL